MKELLIERWFPIHEASIESARERGAQFPPLYQLHVWWSRKPQAASKIVSVLSALPSEAYGKEDFSKLLSAMGLRGDPIKAMEERAKGKKGFGYPVFEGVSPNPKLYMEEAERVWGHRPIGVDLMAGGGSIPFEMARAGYGEVIAGEYNPVAYTILKAALEYPSKYGSRLIGDVESYGRQVLRKLRSKVKEYFPAHPRGQPLDYIWVRMFRCPECGCEVPSLVSLWLDREKGYALYPDVKGDKVELRVVKVEELERRREGGKIESTIRITEGKFAGTTFDTRGYVTRGVLECPKHRHTADRDEAKRQYKEYLKERAAEGYHGSHPARLVAAVLKGRVYVEPTEEMKKAYEKAEEDLKTHWEDLVTEDLIPLEAHEKGVSDRVVIYGLDRYYRMFNARQLLVHAEIVRLLRDLKDRVVEDEVRKGGSREEAEEYSKVITTYLTLAFGKTLDYNSILTSWDRHQGAINHVFDTHAYGWTWAFGEGDMIQHPKGIYQWALNNSKKALKGLVKRLEQVKSNVNIVYGDASKIDIPEKVDVILTDPPYYDNIQYGELSDFFYVWFKKILGDIYPEAYKEPETPKFDEVVANRVRHGSRKLAAGFYEEKVREIFANHYKILRDDGIFVLWFAHKSGSAWSKTIRALLDTGFTITAVWGVRTEMARSLHISGKAALRTNLILTCRKREGRGGYLQDAVREMEQGFEARLEELEEFGVLGPDFLMASQAEALKVASRHWPLRDPQGRMSPGEILDFMMDQAVGHAVNYITRNVAPQIVGVDAPTKFYVLMRHLFGDLASYDDARRLALACLGASGIADPVKEIAVDTGLGRMSSTQIGGESTKVLQLIDPWERVRRGRISDDEDAPVIDQIHRAISLLEEGKSTMEAAEALAMAGGTACEVIRALYQILPDHLTKGRRTIANREKIHIQTLLLSVCQEGLHLIARREIEERETQRRLEDYQIDQEDLSKYDPILDRFMKGKHDAVIVTVEGVDVEHLRTILNKRIKTKNLDRTIKVSVRKGVVYMDKETG